METDPLQNQPVLAPLALLTEQLIRTGKTGIYRQVAVEVDRVVLNTVLRHVKGNQSRASELLGISRTTLRAKLRAVRMATANEVSTP